MTDCSSFEGWDSFTADGRLDVLETLINDTLWSEGYDDVEVKIDDLGGYDKDGNGTWAETTQNDDGSITITFDSDHVDQGSVSDLVDTSYHEAEHAKQYEDGEDYGELDEIDAWDAGSDGGAQWDENCEPDPESSSDGGDDGGDGGLELENIPQDDVEFDWEHLGEGWTP